MTVPNPMVYQQDSAPAALEGYVIVEYIGNREGSMNYRAPSGQAYRFAAGPTEKQKYVRKEDADYFLQKSNFRVRSPNSPVEEPVSA